MFTVNDLKAALESLDESQFDRLEVVHFDNHHFTSRCSENFINAFRAAKADVNDPASLWLLTLRPSHWQRRKHLLQYVESCVCRPINAEDYYAVIVKWTETLLEKQPEFLQRREGLLRAQQMREDWDDVAVIGEYDRDFVVFHWETTV